MRVLRAAVIGFSGAASAALILTAFILIVLSEMTGRVTLAVMALLGAAFMSLGTWGLAKRWYPDRWPDR
ncbi:MAG: hypothetical protein QOH26_25 [Actinomycetota bacterium]|jgi:hypothetical protein|nr:hypothetical protein [Actinomycetota bacterium]